MRPSRLPLSTSVALVLALAPAARADDAEVTRYRETVARGSALFDEGEFAAARAEFEAAYEIHPSPVLLFNIASTYRREGEPERAIALYRAFLERAPAADPRRSLATRTIAELEAEMAALAALEREAAEDAPLPPPTPENQDEDDDAREPPSAPPSPTVDRDLDAPPRSRTGAVLRGAGIGAVAAGVIGAGVALLAARDAGRAEDALAALGPDDSWGLDEQHWYERGESAERRATLWGATSAALVTTGVVLYVVGKRRDRDVPDVTVTPTGDGAVMSWSREW